MEKKFENGKPILPQLTDRLISAILSGEIGPGERLPSVRDFAMMLRVNPNTMQKALTELENLELIYTERTNGKFVTTNTDLILEFRKRYAREKADEYMRAMRRLGFSPGEAVRNLEKKEENGTFRSKRPFEKNWR